MDGHIGEGAVDREHVLLEQPEIIEEDNGIVISHLIKLHPCPDLQGAIAGQDEIFQGQNSHRRASGAGEP